MQRLWSADELGECWTLLPEDLALLTDLPDTGELGLAAQLATGARGPVPDDEADLASAVVGHLAAAVGVRAEAIRRGEYGLQNGATPAAGGRHRHRRSDAIAGVEPEPDPAGADGDGGARLASVRDHGQ